MTHICSLADVFSANKRSNSALVTISRLQNEIARLENSLNTLEAMVEDGQLNQDATDEITRFREELEWERQLLHHYLKGFERKEDLHNLLMCLMEKTKA